MPFPSEHACRLHSPGIYQKESFRRKKSGKTGLILAKKPGSDKMELQSIRYPIADWDEKVARESCQEKGGTFESAAPKEKSSATLKGLLESRIHQSFTVIADKLYGLGMLNQEERIAISSAIGDGLEEFSSKFDELVGDKPISSDIMEQIVGQGWMDKMKEIDANEIIELAEQNSELSDYQLVEKALGEGQGVGAPGQGVGGVDVCVCPKCSEKVDHERGAPCTEVECPKCGAAMEGWEATTTEEEEEIMEEKIIEKEAEPVLSRFFTTKDKDGNDVWVALSGSSFLDREKEIVSRKAIDYGIAHGDKAGQRGELRLYHYPNSRVGECTFQMRQGNFLVEAGTWDTSSRAQKTKEWIDKDPSEVGVSVGFFYNPNRLVKGVYEDEVLFFERSILKKEHASCPWATVKTIQGGLKVGHKADLVEMIGEEETKAVLEGADEASKALEDQGIAFKETEEKPEKVEKEVSLEGLSEDELKALYAKIAALLRKPEEEKKKEVETKEAEEVEFQLNEAAVKAIAEAVKEMLPDNSELEAKVKALEESAEQATEKLTEQVETKVKEVFEDLPKATIYRATKAQVEEKPDVEPQWTNPLDRNFEDGIREIERIQAREAGR